jgi:hypothetical protein
MITEAGTDGYLVKHDPIPDNILNKIKISVQKHGSDRIFIVGHYDCAGHPVDEKKDREDILAPVDKVKKASPIVPYRAYGFPKNGRLRRSPKGSRAEYRPHLASQVLQFRIDNRGGTAGC